MATTPKLTKKQKKSLAFRDRKTGKRQYPNDQKKINEHNSMEGDGHPALEGQDIFGLGCSKDQAERDANEEDGATVGYEEGDAVQHKKGKVSKQSKGETENENVPLSVAVLKGKKRKREVEDDGEVAKNAKQMSSAGKEPDDENKTRQKFILFVGNLKYTTTKEAIARHFALCDPPPEIRLLTPKAKPGAPQKLKSKGCAFLEFAHRNSLQQALKLHQSNLEGRLINVELTAGGGGKSGSRLAKVCERNKALHGQREKRINKEGGSETFLDPQRFSSTSGSLQKSAAKKTWTVGDSQDREAHKGGERHRKRSKLRHKSWGTGVNAIPVG